MSNEQCLGCRHHKGYLIYWDGESEVLGVDLECEMGWLESNGDCPTFSPEKRHTNNHNNTETRQ